MSWRHWQAACFITGMIAASHIATTGATNAENAPKAAAQQDASSQSFSDSLGAAARSARAAAQNDHAQQNNPASKRKDTDGTSQSHAKHTESTNDILGSTQQQSAEVDQTQHTLTLPVQLALPTNTNDDSVSADGSASVDGTSATSGQEPQSMGSSWLSLNGQAAWTRQDSALTQGANSATTQPGSGAIVAQGDSDSNGVAQPLPIQNAPTDSVAPGAGNDPHVKRDDNAQSIQGSPVDAGNPASNPVPVLLSQMPSAPSMAAATVVAATPALSSSVNIAGISGIKANTAFKGLQNLSAGQKNTNTLTNAPVAGAKETDSYLSIQKDAKGQASDSKDSVTTAVQHTSHVETTQQSVAAPAVSTPQANSAVASSVHQQSFSNSLDKSGEIATPSAQTGSPDTRPDSSVATSDTPASAMSSAVVNSAKLLQSIGQSEMRVGMRTAEFGDISIRTSSTRDSISAQISLGHNDLAKTLTAHMPEMQTRLASGEVVDVHIHNDNQSGDFNGSFGNANQNGSNGQTQEDRTSQSNFSNTYSSSQQAVAYVPGSVITAAAASTGRLDIQA